MFKFLFTVFTSISLFTACSSADDGSPSPQNSVASEAPQAEAKVAVTTGDPVLDGVIEWIEADERPEQSQYRIFELRRSTNGFRDGVSETEDTSDDEQISDNLEYLKFQKKIFDGQIPNIVKQRIAEVGAVKILFLQPCGARTEEALGVPESYLTADTDYEMLHNARLISATRAVGIRDFKIPKPTEMAPSSDDEIVDRGVLELNNALWAAQPKAPGDIPLIILDYSEGCGGGETLVQFKTDPVASQLRLIPEFFFTVCAKQKRDPWSNTQCRWWKDVLSEGGEMVAGTYRYHAQTPDGKIRQGRFGITEKRLENPDGSPAETLNIKI
jgi:hypothetical protein